MEINAFAGICQVVLTVFMEEEFEIHIADNLTEPTFKRAVQRILRYAKNVKLHELTDHTANNFYADSAGNWRENLITDCLRVVAGHCGILRKPTHNIVSWKQLDKGKFQFTFNFNRAFEGEIFSDIEKIFSYKDKKSNISKLEHHLKSILSYDAEINYSSNTNKLTIISDLDSLRTRLGNYGVFPYLEKELKSLDLVPCSFNRIVQPRKFFDSYKSTFLENIFKKPTTVQSCDLPSYKASTDGSGITLHEYTLSPLTRYKIEKLIYDTFIVSDVAKGFSTNEIEAAQKLNDIMYNTPGVGLTLRHFKPLIKEIERILIKEFKSFPKIWDIFKMCNERRDELILIHNGPGSLRPSMYGFANEVPGFYRTNEIEQNQKNDELQTGTIFSAIIAHMAGHNIDVHLDDNNGKPVSIVAPRSGRSDERSSAGAKDFGIHKDGPMNSGFIAGKKVPRLGPSHMLILRGAIGDSNAETIFFNTKAAFLNLTPSEQQILMEENFRHYSGGTSAGKYSSKTPAVYVIENGRDITFSEFNKLTDKKKQNLSYEFRGNYDVDPQGGKRTKVKTKQAETAFLELKSQLENFGRSVSIPSNGILIGPNEGHGRKLKENNLSLEKDDNSRYRELDRLGTIPERLIRYSDEGRPSNAMTLIGKFGAIYGIHLKR